jgi:hypothetical protein
LAHLLVAGIPTGCALGLQNKRVDENALKNAGQSGEVSDLRFELGETDTVH